MADGFVSGFGVVIKDFDKIRMPGFVIFVVKTLAVNTVGVAVHVLRPVFKIGQDKLGNLLVILGNIQFGISLFRKVDFIRVGDLF